MEAVLMFKVIQINSIHNNNGVIEYDTNIIKVTSSFANAIEYALKLKLKTGKLYKVERV